MIYGYIRVSTDKQTVENQRYEINQFCKKEGIQIDKWIEETVSGTKKVEDRTLGKLLKKMLKDDIIIASELSRLGRSLLMIMSILNQCMETEVQVWTIKDNFRLGTDISSKVLAFAFGLSAEIERNLISQRTKEALARKKANGQILGRPIGVTSVNSKLDSKEKKIKSLVDKGISFSAIARIIGSHRQTVQKYAYDKKMRDPSEKTENQKKHYENIASKKNIDCSIVLELHKNAMSLRDIAIKLDVTTSQLQSQLKKENLYNDLLAISKENRLKFPSKYRQKNELYEEHN